MKECVWCGRCYADSLGHCPDDGSALVEGPAVGPQLAEKYRILGALGRGGMGRVYRALHSELGQEVAIKLLGPLADDGEALTRFRREGQALALLDHPHVVRVLDCGLDADSGQPYLAMELLAGETLAERIRRDGPLAPAEALPVLRQVAEALDAVHRRGLLHRDLKPSNVLLAAADGSPSRAKLIDFGLSLPAAEADSTLDLACAAAAGGTTAPAALPAVLRGTPAYLAPELLAGGAASPASDLWSFGALAHAALVGRPPLEGPGTTPPSRLWPGLPATLDAPLLAALAPRPADRPPSATAAAEALERAWRRHLAAALGRRLRPRRRAATAALLAAVAAEGLAGPLLPLENRLVDTRFAVSAPRPPRSELVLAVLDEESLAEDPLPLAERADAVALELERLLAAGPRAVGLDLLLPARWRDSEPFNALVLRHQGRLILAAYSPAAGAVLGSEALAPLTTAALGPERTAALFGFVNVEVDEDGRARRARAFFADEAGRLRPSFAAAMAGIEGAAVEAPTRPFWIDFRCDRRRFRRIPWREIEAVLGREPTLLRDRHLIVAAEYVGGEAPFRVPAPRDLPAEVSGGTLQALILDTLLAGRTLRSPHRALAPASAAALGLLATAAALGAPTRRHAAAWLAALALGSTAFAFALFALADLVLPMAAPALAAAAAAATAAAAVAVGERRERALAGGAGR